ncbi:hypothetical protein M1437_00155 [Patescibacteria group bacterium]|nr:hypothetical protein [Patescibacteria group bacterium]
MTIERIVVSHGKTLKVTRLIPGAVETLSSPIMNGEEVNLHVDTDDDITINYLYVQTSGNITKRKLLEAVKLSKHEINNHTLQASPSLFSLLFRRGEVTRYRWVPSHLHISPEQEMAIRALVKDGTYTDKDAEEVRDQMLFEEQRKIDGFDDTKK